MMPRSHRRPATTLLACLVLVGVGLFGVACATPQADADADAAATGPGGTPTAEPTPSDTIVTPTEKPLPEVTAGDTVTIVGTVTEGVERGCRVLVADDGKQYLLLDGDEAVLAAGGRVEVRGMLRPDVVSVCQQGTPISVVSARRV